MPNLLRHFIVPVTFLLLTAGAPLAEAVAAANIAHGKTIAEKGPAAGAKPCSSCHGANGEGDAANAQPRLAGQNAAYLQAQLAAFRAGDRANEKMTPIAKALDASEIADVAAYYASLPAPEAPKAAARNAQISEGAYLALRGDWAHDIPPCASCHGVTGRGVGAAVPPLAHQPAAYLARQMHAWKEGTRRGDPLGVMQASARRTSDAQIAAVSAYYETQSDAAAKTAADTSLAEPKTEAAAAKPKTFVSPPNSAIPDTNFGKVVKLGEAIFRHTGAHAGAFVGNSLTCANCHLGGGRRADSAPWARPTFFIPPTAPRPGRWTPTPSDYRGAFATA